MDKSLRFWQHWLLVASVGTMLFGATLVVAPGFTQQLFSQLVFAAPGAIAAFDETAVAYIALAHAVLGATMVGWGAALLAIVLGPFSRGSRAAWLGLTVSLAAWFLPDTAFSLWSGFWQNAVLNLTFAILFAIPLAATRRLLQVGRDRTPTEPATAED